MTILYDFDEIIFNMLLQEANIYAVLEVADRD